MFYCVCHLEQTGQLHRLHSKLFIAINVTIMRTFITVAIVMATSVSQAQVYVTAAAGTAFTRLYGPQTRSSDFKTSMTYSMSISKIISKNYSLQGSLAYIENGDQLKRDFFRSKLLIKYIQVAAILERSFPIGKITLNASAGAGVNAKVQAFSTFQDGNSFTETSLGYIRDVDVAMIVGVRGSYKIQTRLEIFLGLQTQLGLLDLSLEDDVTIRNVSFINQLGMSYLLRPRSSSRK